MSGYETDAQRDWAAEDRAGADAMPEPTPAERSQIQRWIEEVMAEQTPEELEELRAQNEVDEALRDADDGEQV